MILKRWVDERNLTLNISLQIHQIDFEKLELTAFEKAMIADCSRENSTISDHLLALELICRKIEENESIL